jgi:hypothetical protein
MMDRYGRDWERVYGQPDSQRNDFYDWAVFLGCVALVAMLAVLMVW